MRVHYYLDFNKKIKCNTSIKSSCCDKYESNSPTKLSFFRMLVICVILKPNRKIFRTNILPRKKKIWKRKREFTNIEGSNCNLNVNVRFFDCKPVIWFFRFRPIFPDRCYACLLLIILSSKTFIQLNPFFGITCQ